MSKEKYFAHYKSPNTVIIPTAVCYPPSPKRPRVEILKNQSPQHVDLSFLDDFDIDEIVECLYDCDYDSALIEKVNDTSTLPNQHSVVDLNSESANVGNTDDCNGKNNEQKNLIGLDNKNVQDDSLKKEETTNILYYQNANVNHEVNTKDHAHTFQCNQVSEDTVNVPVRNEADMIKNVKIENDLKLIDSKNNEFISIKHNASTNANQSIHSNNNTFATVINIKKTEDNNFNLTPKETKNIQKEIIKVTDVIEKKEALNQIQFNEHTTLPNSAKKSKIDIPSTALEKTMYNYLHTKYTVESKIHQGKFSRIFKCQDSAGKLYTVKMLNKKTDKAHIGMKQGKMLMDIQIDIPKENLFCVYCKNKFPFNGYWCFLMEFYPKNLKQVMEESPKSFHINMVQDLARQLVAAVTLLRNNNIVHADISPSHILLNTSNTKLKLCGFDASYYIYEAGFFPNGGSIWYRSPEVILGYSSGFSIDVWSTALILHEMATGQKLFPGFNNWDILYEQMCNLGKVPIQMLKRSKYANKYFFKGMFKKKGGAKNEEMLIFKKTNKVKRTIYDAYYSHWAPLRTNTQKNMDIEKIKSLISLLDQMFVIYPNHRLRIEFVYANPFIYEMFDC